MKQVKQVVMLPIEKPEKVMFIWKYLISKGYDVPLWFGVDYPCNGKTAIELGIAISKI